MASFEIELRGILTEAEKQQLESLLIADGKLIRQYKRTQWCFGLDHQKKIDFRIKETNGECEFCLKVGKLGNTNRKEISIPFPADKQKQALELCKFLGHKEGVRAFRIARIYEYKNIEWAIIEAPGGLSYFEAEKLVKSKSEGKEAEEEIKKIASELGLKILTPKETIDYIKVLDKKSNKIFKF